MSRCRVVCYRGLSLQLTVLYNREFKLFFQYHIALFKTFVQISHGELGHTSNIVSNKAGMNGRRLRVHGLQRIKDRRQLLVFHPDQFQGLLCRLLRVRGDGRHLVSHIAQLPIKDLLIFHRDCRRVCFAAGTVKTALRCIFICSYGTYSRQFFRFRRIDGHDSGMWIRASKHLSVQHSGKL